MAIELPSAELADSLLRRILIPAFVLTLVYLLILSVGLVGTGWRTSNLPWCALLFLTISVPTHAKRAPVACRAGSARAAIVRRPARRPAHDQVHVVRRVRRN